MQALALDDSSFKLIWESLKNFAKAKEVASKFRGLYVKLQAYQQR
jgi:hypothetical protein